MNISVEFAGISRILAKTKKVSLDLEAETSFREILQKLATMYPDMVGQVIGAQGDSLLASNMLNLNGKYMVRPEQMDSFPKEGDRLILMSILAGG